MAVQYPKVPQAKITSLDITSFAGGLDQRGEANIAPNAFSVGTNAMVDSQGLVTFRPALKRWLPDIVGTAYEVFPALYNGVINYIVADNGVIKHCVDGDVTWTTCGGDTVTTAGVVTTFVRALDKVLILNGVDYLGYVDLTNFNVVHFTPVADPTTAPTATVSGGITGTSFKVYYTYWYSGQVGTTISAPILTQPVGKIREQWVASTDGVTITRPGTAPTGARSWNLGLATAPAGGTIQFSDILPIALGLDLATTTFLDNGSITQITTTGTAPSTNTTAGPKAKYGEEIEGRPFLYGITGDPYAVLIGGDDVNALDFTAGNGGYRLVLNQGTNFYPQSVIGFRNGTGTPSITVLFSNTEGLSKQSIIEQSTVSLGTFSATVWGATEQNYGAAGVSSSYAVVNYKGDLVFPTTDGIIKIDTQASLQNVLLPQRISDPIIDEIQTIQVNLLPQIVGTANSNRFLFSVPAHGFTYNNEIVVYDVTRSEAPCWYIFDIRSQWIGTISPFNKPQFTYICQDNHFFTLSESYVAQDELPNGLTQPFALDVTSALIGANTAHNAYYAVVQTMFYLEDFIGTAQLIVAWRDYQSGKMKSRTRTVTNGSYTSSSVGNWSSPGYLYNAAESTIVKRWGDVDKITGNAASGKISKPYPVKVNNVVTNELQARVVLNPDGSAVRWRSASFEGQSLGINPEVR